LNQAGGTIELAEPAMEHLAKVVGDLGVGATRNLISHWMSGNPSIERPMQDRLLQSIEFFRSLPSKEAASLRFLTLPVEVILLIGSFLQLSDLVAFEKTSLYPHRLLQASPDVKNLEQSRHLFSKAVQKARSILEEEDREDTEVECAEVLKNIASAQAGAGQLRDAAVTFGEAKRVASLIVIESDRSDAFKSIASAQASAGQLSDAAATFAEAKAAANLIQSQWERLSWLESIATAQASAGQLDDALATFGEAREIANSLPEGDDMTIQMLERLDTLQAQASLGQLGDALATFGEARFTANPLSGQSNGISELISLAALEQAKGGDLSEAISRLNEAKLIASSISNLSLRCAALKDIATTEVGVGALDAAIVTFSQAIDAANAILDSWLRSEELKDIAIALASAGQLNDAVVISNSITAPGVYTQSLVGIAATLV
jgi:tetratricopeptide (TPR) repeat protein